MTTKAICILGDPFAWRRAARTRSGRSFTDKEMRAHQKMVAAQACRAWGDQPPLFGPVKLLVMATFAIPAGWSRALRAAAAAGDVHCDAKPDFDNIAKQITDALAFVAYVDDCQIADGRSILRYGEAPATEVLISRLPGPATPATIAREKRWRAGSYDDAIAAAPCGAVRWPRLLKGAEGQ